MIMNTSDPPTQIEQASPPNNAQMNAFVQGADFEIDLRNFLLMLWRRKFLIITVMLICISITFFLIKSVKPRYTAKALMMIEGNSSTGPELSNLMMNFRVDNTFILSEAEVLKSRIIAQRVVQKLDLMNDPEFNPLLRHTLEQSQKDAKKKEKKNNKTLSLFSSQPTIKGAAEEMIPSAQNNIDTAQEKEILSSFKTLKIYDQQHTDNTTLALNQHNAIVLDLFMRNIVARPLPGSYVIQMEYTSENPDKAALIVNTIIEEYIKSRLEQRLETSKRLSSWLDERLSSLRTQLRQSEEAIEEFRQENNIISGVRVEVSLQQMSELNSQLVLAKTKRAEAQARLRQINGWLENPSTIETTDEAQTSRILQNLKLKDTEVRKHLSEISTRYGDKHPSIIDAKQELTLLESQIKAELLSVARALESKLKVADARVNELKKSISDVEKIRQVESKAGITMRELMRESESSQAIFDAFLSSYKRSDEQEKLQQEDVRILSAATSPRIASYPNKPLFLSLSMAASFFLGIALSLLLEKLDNAYKTVTQIEKETGYPCFGMIPYAPRIPKRKPVADFVFEKKGQHIAEATRTIRMILNLQAKNKESRPKVITITSSLPNEGKTTFSSWMAKVSARAGEKVIVIDCDLRCPRIAPTFGISPKQTLVEYLTGRATLDEIITQDDSGAHVICARSVPNNAMDLLSKDNMASLISALRKTYSLVILDTPANMAVSDARLMAAQSDKTLYAVSWNDTPREVVNSGIKNFADFGYTNLSFILTNVDVRRHALYGYGDPMSYYKQYKKYYS